jgi:hypothetical protein
VIGEESELLSSKPLGSPKYGDVIKMEDADFDAFIARTTQELRSKQDTLTETYGLGKHAEYWLDLSLGILQFKGSTGDVLVEANVTPIGSFSEKRNTWQWGWANQSLDQQLRDKSEALKDLVSVTGFEVFDTPIINADEQMAWELAAMAVSQFGSLGCYRIPKDNLHIFVSIDEIRRIS